LETRVDAVSSGTFAVMTFEIGRVIEPSRLGQKPPRLVSNLDDRRGAKAIRKHFGQIVGIRLK